MEGVKPVLPQLALFSGKEGPRPFLSKFQQPVIVVKWIVATLSYSNMYKILRNGQSKKWLKILKAMNRLTSFGGPMSRMSCLIVGITVTLTFSNGSMTSLKTLSWPSITTSCQLPRQHRGATLNFWYFSSLLMDQLKETDMSYRYSRQNRIRQNFAKHTCHPNG